MGGLPMSVSGHCLRLYMAAITASRSPMARIYVCLNCGPTLGVVVEHQ